MKVTSNLKAEQILDPGPLARLLAGSVVEALTARQVVKDENEKVSGTYLEPQILSPVKARLLRTRNVDLHIVWRERGL